MQGKQVPQLSAMVQLTRSPRAEVGRCEATTRPTASWPEDQGRRLRAQAGQRYGGRSRRSWLGRSQRVLHPARENRVEEGFHCGADGLSRRISVQRPWALASLAACASSPLTGLAASSPAGVGPWRCCSGRGGVSVVMWKISQREGRDAKSTSRHFCRARAASGKVTEKGLVPLPSCSADGSASRKLKKRVVSYVDGMVGGEYAANLLAERFAVRVEADA